MRYSLRNAVESSSSDSTGMKAAKFLGVLVGGALGGVLISSLADKYGPQGDKGWLQDVILAAVGLAAGGFAIYKKMPTLAMGLAAAPVAIASERYAMRSGFKAWMARTLPGGTTTTAPAGYPLSDNAYTSWNGAGLPISSSAYINGVGGTTSGVYQQVMAR